MRQEQRYSGYVGWLLSAVALAVLPGCLDGFEAKPGVGTTFVTSDRAVQLRFPKNWSPSSDSSAFDLQCFSPLEQMMTGVFSYRRSEIDETAEPIDAFWHHVDHLQSERINVESIEPERNYETRRKLITSLAFAGDRGDSRYCYVVSLVEFKQDDSRFVVLVQAALPSNWERAKPILQRIVRSAELLPDDREAVESSDGAADSDVEEDVR